MAKYDFAGWATKANLKCSDGRTIMPDAFKGCDGKVVPLVWNHRHEAVTNVLGHALLENTKDGVKAYATFNDTENGRDAKTMVEHGDICALSIYANDLQQRNSDVIHGVIREVSLVLAGANPGACITTVGLEHSADAASEGVIFTGEAIELYHSDDNSNAPENNKDASGEKTVEDIVKSMTEEQRTVMYGLLGASMTSEGDDDEEGEENNDMKHNIFDKNDNNTLTHSQIEEFAQNVFADAKRMGSFRDAFLAYSQDYGITTIDMLFPDYKSLNNPPEFIKRDNTWVTKLMNNVHHSPMTRIKSVFANITADEARAKGYTKGKKKLEEVFTLLKRTTDPQTIYKKQKLDRDDILDITDFDVVAWLRSEMRMMLNEEIARAILIGDGRSAAAEDKIKEDKIRPIWKDDDLYTIKAVTELEAGATEGDEARAFIRSVIKNRKEYKGSGNPFLFTTEDTLTKCLLLEDKNGRTIYENVSQLETKLRVKEIITVEVMEDQKRSVSGTDHILDGILVNPWDYNVGADKGGEINTFDDFDIDYNQYKYLIETRISGALVKPYSAIAIEHTVKNS